MKARRPDWIFDGSEIDDPFGYGERAVDFIKRLRHPKSRLPDQAFELPMFWERIIRRVYGPCYPNGQRQVRTVFVLLPRGARKTTMGGALSLLHTAGWERVAQGQAMVAASAEEQARIAYDEALGIAEVTPWLSAKMKPTESLFVLEHIKSGSSFKALSSDGKSKLGKTPNFVLADELIAWEGAKAKILWSALSTGLNKVSGTLLVIITQAGRGQENLAFQFLDRARKIQSGEIEDPHFLPVLFETDPDENSKWTGAGVAEFDGWEDESLWHYVNPGLADGYPDIVGLRAMALAGRDQPFTRDELRQFHLNTWLDYSASPFVEMPIYDEGNLPVDLDEFEREQTPCWLGVDVSSNSDLTAIVAAWGNPDDGYAVQPWFFLPKDNLFRRGQRDDVNYPLWVEQEHIIPTEGNVVDPAAVEDHIRELCARFNVQEIAFDPHLARVMMSNILEDGLPAVEMRQGWITMAPAVKELERAILGRIFRHGGNPVLRWHFDNIAVERDKAGNMSFHKGNSKDRIDGAVATAMAVGRAAQGDGGSIYTSPTFTEDMGVF